MNVLENLFTDIADAIRDKTGETDAIRPIDFPEKIAGIKENSVELLENVLIQPDFSNGDQSFSAPDEMAVKSAIIQKPETLIPENIAEGVEIAGIVGTMKSGGGGTGVQYTCDSSGYITAAKFTGLEFLPTRLFYYHSYLTSVDLTESPNLAGVGREAFSNCTRLTGIVLPDSTEKIDYRAFYNCTKLENVVLSSKLATCGGFEFQNCTALAEITIPSGAAILGNGMFYGCTALTEITIPQSIKRIDINAFYGCTALASAVFESPNNWKYGNSYGSPKGTINMANPATAAAYLNSTYAVYYLWQD